MNLKSLLLGILFFNLSTIISAQSEFTTKIDSLFKQGSITIDHPNYKKYTDGFLNKKEYHHYLYFHLKLSEDLAKKAPVKATKILQKAISRSEAPLGTDSLLAFSYHKLAILFFEDLQEDEPAILNWQKAIFIREAIFPCNHLDIIKAYRNIGLAFRNINQWEDGLVNCQKSIDLNLSRSQIDSIQLMKAYNNLGWIYINFEDYHQAEKFINIAKKGYEHLFKEKPWLLHEAYENLAEYYRRKEKFTNVIKIQKELLAIYEEMPDKIEADSQIMANAYNNLGLGYEQSNQLDSALVAYLNSLAINEKYIKKNAKGLTGNYNNIAETYKKRKEYGKALASIEKAIEYDLKLNSKSELATSLNNKAMILLDKGALKEALIIIDDVIAIYKPNESFLWNKTKLVAALSDKLKIIKKLGKKDYAYLSDVPKIIDQITKFINEIRTEYQSGESKSFLAEKTKPILENAIHLSLALYQNTNDNQYLTQAFDLSEQSKSIILLDAFKEAQTRRTVNVSPALLRRKTSLTHQLTKKEKALFLEQEQNKKELLDAEIVQINRKMTKLVDTIRQFYPKYYSATYKTNAPRIENIYESIEGSLLEYFVGDSIIYAFLLSKERADIQVVEIPRDFPLADWVQQLGEGIYMPFVKNIRSSKTITQYNQDYAKAAYNLHEKLIKPIISQFQLDKKVVVIPDGVLGYIPFDVLISQLPKEGTLFRDYDYLLYNHEISYSYSANLLMEMQNKVVKQNKEHSFLAFAPTFRETKTLVAQNRQSLRSDLEPLKHNIPEVEALQSSLGGKTYIGKQATRLNFINQSSKAKVIHLATHGKANDEVGDYAFLAFTNVQNTTEFKLYNRELYNLDIDVEMVSLSACETATGELKTGEGIISLARGFSYAGAKSIITTLWSVNGEQTQEIMQYFYENLKNGQTKSEALRNAKLDFIKDNSQAANPFFWAVFVPIGDMQSINLGSCICWLYFLMAGFITVILVFSIRQKKSYLSA